MRQADLIEHRLLEIPGVTRVKVFFRSGNVSVNFEGAQCREDLIDAFSRFDFEEYEENHLVPVNTGRAINAEYQDKLVMKVVTRSLRRIFLPMPPAPNWPPASRTSPFTPRHSSVNRPIPRSIVSKPCRPF